MKRIAVILSGCGVFDGAEIHESVLTLLALDRAGVEITCAAPDVTQHHVINHLTGQPADGESRNVLVESARIARGKIIPLSKLDPSSIDAVILPGGFGAAKNLCNFALVGRNFEVNPEVSRFLQEFHKAGKPIGFLCIAPAIAARLFGGEQLEFTIGNDADTAHALEASGGKHVTCDVRDIVIDQKRKVVTTPAYMLGQRISEVESGINKLVQVILEMA